MGRKKIIVTGNTSTQQIKKIKKDIVDIDKKIKISFDENNQEKTTPLNNKQIADELYGKKFNLRGKNKKQKDLFDQIEKKQIIIIVGATGSGKSYCGIGKALELIANPDNNYQKIFIINPTNNNLSYYLIDKIIGKPNRLKLLDMKIIETLNISDIDGISIDNSILIAEEMQKTTEKEFLNVITRLGFNAKIILNGSLDDTLNGLSQAVIKLNDIEEISIVNFEDDDIIRNPLINKILKKYK